MELQWELMSFTLFVCIGAGTFAVQGLLAILGRGKGVQMPALAVSFAAVALGGFGSFLHLQHWERVFNGFGRLGSGITQELIGIVAFVMVLIIYFLMLRRSADEHPPRWCGALALAVSAALVVVMGRSYGMAARPAWDTQLLWLFYVCNAAFLGSLTVAVVSGLKEGRSSTAVPRAGAVIGNAATGSQAGVVAMGSAVVSQVDGVDRHVGAAEAIRGATAPSVRAAQAAGIAQAVMTAACAVYFTVAAGSFSDVGYYFDPTRPTKPMVDPGAAFAGVFIGGNAPLFWGGIVVIGLVVPIVLAFLARRRRPRQVAAMAATALVCAATGSLCFRAVVYILGFSAFMFY